MKRKGTVCIVLGVLLVLAALGLSAYNYLDSRRAGRQAAEAVEHLEQVLPEPVQATADAPAGEAVIPDYVLDPTRDMPVREIDGVAYAALLEIPALELKLPVLAEWSYDNLRLGPCRYSGSVYRNDLVIAGHNYASQFGTLRSLALGDRVYVTDMDGSRFAFEVAELHTLAPEQVEEMTDSEWDLTLFTCTVGGATRLAVCCTRVIEE